MAQLGGHDGGLQRVQPEISSYKFVMVFRLGAVRAQALQSFGPPRVVGNNHSPITGRAKILGWKERKASIVPDGAGSPAFVFGANRLRRVFDDHQVMFPSDSHNRIHLRHLAVQMNWNDGASLPTHFRNELIWIQVVSKRINVHKHRRGSNTSNRSGSCKKRVRSGDHFIAWTDILCH